VWIATANVKELMIEDHRARPGRRRTHARVAYASVLATLDELAARGVELRLLHAELPSRPFREAIAHHPRLVAGGLALRRCPRVHMKVVVIDGELLYLGSANWTGAGLGAKGSGRRNFELGIVTSDVQLLDDVQHMYQHVWQGAGCAGCRLRDVCPGPLDERSEVVGGGGHAGELAPPRADMSAPAAKRRLTRQVRKPKPKSRGRTRRDRDV
jgi:phosphatidylserine/phosphatidylglycerophosphate/cardiolipin synthase-like enzyme